MTPAEIQRLEAWKDRVHGLSEQERETLMAAECARDPGFRAEVERLTAAARTLEATEKQLHAGPSPTPGRFEAPSSSGAAGPRIEGYEIVREVHRGGQGVVYQAIQRSTKRKVAIKVLLDGAYAGKSAQRRFEREIELVAQFKHPCIIAVFDSGRTVDGSAYCVMDYVRGKRLDQHVRQEDLTLEDALRLFAQVCEAVGYAHQKGVIHRDLKPANILVDAGGTPKVLDFGLAKHLGGPEESMPVSMTGQLMGTLAYMAPEQARGEPDKIDVLTDVYALGVILYELLTGQSPYPVGGQMTEALRHIAETTPTAPSRTWKKDTGVTRRSSRRTRAGECPIDDEVETIVLRALAKERSRRYQSAGELARDIGHYLANEPIEAKRDSGWYVLRKQLRRYRGQAVVAGCFVAILAGVAALMSVMWNRERGLTIRLEEEGRRADRLRIGAEKAAGFMGDMLEGVDASVALGRDTTLLREMLDKAAERIRAGKLGDSPEAELRLRLAIGNAYLVSGGKEGLEKAEEFLRPAPGLAERAYGDKSLEMAWARNGLAKCLYFLGRLEEARQEASAAVAVVRGLATANDREAAKSLTNLAASELGLGQGEAALTHFEEALTVQRRVHQGDHQDVAIAIGSVGSALQALRRPEEALPRFQEALEMCQRVFPKDHPHVAISLNRLGGCFEQLGRSQDALPHLHAALEMRRRLHGGDHPNVMTSLNNVAACLDKLDKLEESLALREEELAMMRRLHGPDRPEAAAKLFTIGNCLDRLRRPKEAAARFRESLEIQRKNLKGQPPGMNFARTLQNLAACEVDTGRAAEGRKSYEEAIEIYRRSNPPGDLGVLYPQTGLALALIDLGAYADAEALLLDAFRQLEGKDEPKLLRRTIERLAKLYEAWAVAEPEKQYGARADEWRQKLDALTATSQPATTAPSGP